MMKVMNLMNPVISSGGSDETDTITDHPSGDLLGNQINVFGKAFSGKFCLIKLFFEVFWMNSIWERFLKKIQLHMKVHEN